MMTQHGPYCDVCGNPILPFINESINPFSVTGIADMLHACDKCKGILQAAGKDWKQLPTGRLRSAFEDDERQRIADAF